MQLASLSKREGGAGVARELAEQPFLGAVHNVPRAKPRQSSRSAGFSGVKRLFSPVTPGACPVFTMTTLLAR
jgi:hypothetical protein